MHPRRSFIAWSAVGIAGCAAFEKRCAERRGSPSTHRLLPRKLQQRDADRIQLRRQFSVKTNDMSQTAKAKPTVLNIGASLLAGATGCVDEKYPRETGVRADVLTITKRSKARAGLRHGRLTI